MDPSKSYIVCHPSSAPTQNPLTVGKQHSLPPLYSPSQRPCASAVQFRTIHGLDTVIISIETCLVPKECIHFKNCYHRGPQDFFVKGDLVPDNSNRPTSSCQQKHMKCFTAREEGMKPSDTLPQRIGTGIISIKHGPPVHPKSL
jgi:hypothetical protein